MKKLFTKVLRRMMKTAAAGAMFSLLFSTAVSAAPKKMPDGGIFDVQYYAQNNPDVTLVYGYSETALYRHFQKYGIKEGRLPYAPGADVSDVTDLDNAVWSGEVTRLLENNDLAQYASTTNPAQGTAVKTTALKDIRKYKWADFARYNSDPARNGLEGQTCYIVGVVNQILPAAYITYRDENGTHHNIYSLYVIVDDIDGYQWLVQTCALDENMETLSGDILGKDCFLFGSYTGYSEMAKMPILSLESVMMSDSSVHTWNEYSPVHF